MVYFSVDRIEHALRDCALQQAQSIRVRDYLKNLPVSLFVVQPIQKQASRYSYPILYSEPPALTGSTVSKGFNPYARPTAPPVA